MVSFNFGLVPNDADVLRVEAEASARELEAAIVGLAFTSAETVGRISAILQRFRNLAPSPYGDPRARDMGARLLELAEAPLLELGREVEGSRSAAAQALRVLSEISRYLAFVSESQRTVSADSDAQSRVIGAGRFYFEVSDPTEAVRLVAAAQALMRALAADEASAVDAMTVEAVEPGSVWVRFKKAMQALVEKDVAQEIADQTRQGLEANFVEKAQAENALSISTAIANIMRESAASASVSIDAGPFLIAKITDDSGATHWRARARSSRELAQQHVSDRELQNPKRLFDSIEELASKDPQTD
jgi:hypothetical protein